MPALEAYLKEGDGISLKIRKGNAVYHLLKTAILLGDLKPGKAIGEQAIAARMGCSQGTVREGLLRLQEDGLVQRRGYRGTFVSETTIEEAAEMAAIRIQLEAAAIRRAAESHGETERQRLIDILERMEEAGKNGDSYALSELDRMFHLTLFEASGMPILEPVLSRCALHMHRYTFANNPQKSGTSPMKAHQSILDALDSRQGDRAAEAVTAHIEAVLERWSPELLKSVRKRNRIQEAL